MHGLTLRGGELRAGTCKPQALADYLARLSPSEILLPEEAPVPSGVSAAVRHLPGWDFDPSSAHGRMCERFGVRDLRGFGLEDEPLAVGSAMALLGYAEHTQCQRLEHLWQVGAERQSANVAMDATARISLEITVPATEGGPTLLKVLDRCSTSMGSRLVARRLHNPLRDVPELEARLDACYSVLKASERIRDWLVDCGDIERITTRVMLGRVRPREMVALRSVLARMPDLAATMENVPDTGAKRFAPVYLDYGDIAGHLASALAEDPSAQLRDGGVIATGHDAELDRLRDLQTGAGNTLKEIESKERELTGITALRVGHNRVHGYYLELPRSQSDLVPQRYRRRQTTKHAERYVTDELADLEEQAASAQSEALAAEARLYARLVEDLGRHESRLRSLAEAISDLDVAACMAGHAKDEGWVRPKFDERPVLSIKQGRHPVVEAGVDHFVPNDTEMGATNNMEIVTGPNMGGKSTYMRQVALIALLAHIGSPVPADMALVGDIDAIMTRIGASDDLAGGRSTFMVEMSETASILNTASERTLVILDEIGRGTSTFDGLSLAWATAQVLLERNRSLVLLATHYLEMAEIADSVPAAKNLHMAVGESKGEVVMLHRIEPGASSRSFGLQVAKMAGIPPHVLALARKRLAVLESGAASGESQGRLFAPTMQSADRPPNPALELLRKSDIEDISPRQAQELLFELKALDDED